MQDAQATELPQPTVEKNVTEMDFKHLHIEPEVISEPSIRE